MYLFSGNFYFRKPQTGFSSIELFLILVHATVVCFTIEFLNTQNGFQCICIIHYLLKVNLNLGCVAKHFTLDLFKRCYSRAEEMVQ